MGKRKVIDVLDHSITSTTIVTTNKRKKRSTKVAKRAVRLKTYNDMVDLWDDDDYVFFTDGGARPSNPGPTGVGMVMVKVGTMRRDDWSEALRWSEAPGHGTNNTAELKGLYLASIAIKARVELFEHVHVHVVTDSAYSVLVVTKLSAKLTTNVELITTIRKAYADLEELVKVHLHTCPGHCNITGNVLADRLATAAALTGVGDRSAESTEPNDA
jgi:ribonuclease HI